MRTIQRSLVALLLLIAVTAQAQNHKLTLKSAVGPVLSITILMHDEYGYFDDFHEAYSLYAEGVPNTFDVAPGDSVKIHITRYEQSGWKYTYTEMDGVKVHEAKKDYSADLTPTDIFMLTMANSTPTTHNGACCQVQAATVGMMPQGSCSSIISQATGMR